MRVLLISSAFSGLTQRFYTELEDAGYTVSVELHLGDIPRLMEGVSLFNPDLIVCPYLTRRLPRELYVQTKCLIVHPGIKGDRGPSSLDWAIQNREPTWGVTLLEAQEEMDAGDIWASRTFPMRAATKSSLFYREVTQAAVDCLWEALTYFASKEFRPEPLNYDKPEISGRLRPLMRQPERAIDWKKHRTEDILDRIRAADGSPGVLDDINGIPFYLYNAHEAKGMHGKPGEIIAVANHAICRATVNGAIWIGHIKPKLENGDKGLKLPAAALLQELLASDTVEKTLVHKLIGKSIKHITIDYTKPGRQLPCQEVWYELDAGVAYLHFAFHNGGMGTEQCRLLLEVYRHILTLEAAVIVLMGGPEFWSNGIHLNHIERAENPADESWDNINAMDDLILQIITTMDKLTIAAVAGNAGAGGAILAAAPDMVFARDGVVLNPHYKNMGELFGSEYWTYLLPKRVGYPLASSLTEDRLPISAKKAWRIGLIDKMLDKNHPIFYAQIRNIAKTYAADKEFLRNYLTIKAKKRCADEAAKPLASYRRFELTQMFANFYDNDLYHSARKKFVFKQSGETTTPDNIAQHRRQNSMLEKILPGSLSHFLWQDQYQTGDHDMDGQHKDLFVLAEQLVVSTSYDELNRRFARLTEHVGQHFKSEEHDMRLNDYYRLDAHAEEHHSMLSILEEMALKIKLDSWNRQDLESFLKKWSLHIVNADMEFNNFVEVRKNSAPMVE